MSRINPFKLKPKTDNLKRNTFDMSFVNNFSCKIGDIVPVMCKEVIPGDSVHIDPTLFLKTMTMKRPILNDVKAKLSFFYVRNRNLVNGWRDFIGKTDDGNFIMPYIKQTDPKFFEVGSLSDYLGVPCSFVDSNSTQISLNIAKNYEFDYSAKRYEWADGDALAVPYFTSTNSTPLSNLVGYYSILPTYQALLELDPLLRTGHHIWGKDPSNVGVHFPTTSVSYYFYGNILQPVPLPLTRDAAIEWSYLVNSAGQPGPRNYSFLICENLSGNERMPEAFRNMYPANQRIIRGISRPVVLTSEHTQISESIYRYSLRTSLSDIPVITKDGAFSLIEYVNNLISEGRDIYIIPCFMSAQVPSVSPYKFVFESCSFTGLEQVNSVTASGVSNPFLTVNNETRLPISALPYRAYESICNSWYRDQQNNPLLDANGKAIYNEFLLNKEIGADIFPYTLHKCNWEQDVFTTAMQSPQQGVAPLVGIRENQLDTKEYSLRYKDGEGVDHVAKITANGNEISGINVLGKESEIDADLSKALAQSVSMGISINDFRNVNSLQRWLEKNMRRGFRYKEQMQSHFGIELSLEELDMPEYLGGITQSLNTNALAQQSGDQIGDEVGKGFMVANTSNTIDAFFDEHGYVMALLTIVPIPTYSQILPKHFLKKDALDFFFPEFNHLGPQAIKYKELCPLQTFNEKDGSEKLEETFGYQRAWYDYLSSFDEVHGELRTTMKDYLMNREFAESPELGEDFLVVDAHQVNDVFVFTDNTDKIYGQCKFDFSMKRPIAMFGEPSLE